MKHLILKSATALGMIGFALITGMFFLSDFGDGQGKIAIASTSELKAGMVDPKNGKKIKYWVAPMDPTYIRYTPGKSPMGMDLVPKYEEDGQDSDTTSTIRVDPTTVQNMGVRLAPVERKKLTKTIRAFGNITYDERRLYTVNTKFDGWIERLFVNHVGQQVSKGQALFEIYSPDLVTAQEEYLLAQRQLRSLSANAHTRIRENAERLLAAARTRLQYWDITEGQIQRLEKTGSANKNITVFSPASGVVLKKNAYEGHFVKAGQHQFEIADLSNVWVDVEVYEYELPWVQEGMRASMELSYVPGRHFDGKVLYVYPYLSEKTRTARLRLEFANRDLELKPEMYATIYLNAAAQGESLVVPQEAVIDSGVRKVTFVAKGEGRFEPREVQVGMEVNGHEYQILSGLNQGELVVTSAQFLLDSESRLREAIQKMLAVSSTEQGPSAMDDLEIEGMTMDDEGLEDMDMSGLSMETEKKSG